MPVRRLAIVLLLTSASLLAAPLDEATRQFARDVLQQLIAINTTDSGGSTTEAAQAMAKRLLDAGFAAEDVKVLGPNDRKGNLVVRLRGTSSARRPILIIGHLDVVEAHREDWTSDPFVLAERDGYFYGRGTQDMKATAAILVTTFIRFRQEGWWPERDFVLALTADEEGGQFNGVEWLLANHRDLIDAEFVLNADTGNVTALNGKAVNVDITVSEKLYADFQLSATEAGGHSSMPVPDNAIYRIAGALMRLERTPFAVELNDITLSYFERRAALESGQTRADMNAMLRTPADVAAATRLSQDPLYNATLRTTCVPTRLSAGHANNALPRLAQANVNCRILPGHSAEEIRHALIELIDDPEVQVRYVTYKGDVVERAPENEALAPVLPSPEVMQSLERVAAEMWPGTPVIPTMVTGASDSFYTIAAGIPTYGVNGLAIDQNDIRAHGKDERLRVSAYYDGVEFYYRYLQEIGSVGDHPAEE